MKKRNSKTGQYEHDWGFMANAGSLKKGDLLQCQHDDCGVWSYMGNEPYWKMGLEGFIEMHERGEIDAIEVLGYPRGTKKP